MRVSKPTVVIDAGHGGVTAARWGQTGVREDGLIVVAKKLKDLFEKTVRS